MATTAAELQVKATLDDQASKKVEGMGMSFSKLTAAVGLGSLAASAFQKAASFVTETVKGSIKAAQEAEVSQVKVNAILKTLTGSYEEHTQAVEEASRVALQLGFDDEDAAESMAKLLQVTGDTTQAQEAMTNAMDLARFKGISLTEASQAMTLALGGNTRVLKQLGIEVPDNATKIEVMGLVMQRVGGQADAFGKTAAGAQERFKQSLENLQESIGARVLPIVSRFFNAVSNFITSDKLQGWINEIGRLYNEYLKPIIEKFVIPAFEKLAEAIRPHLPLIQNIIKVIFGTAGLALIGTLIVLSKAIEVIAIVFDAMATAIEKVIDWIKQLIDWFKKAAAPINDLKDSIGAVFDKVGNTVGGIGGGIRDLFRAEGGPVSAGKAYIVGEKGPEWFVPGQSGTIQPNGMSSNVTVNFNGDVRSDQDMRTLVATVRSIMNRELALTRIGV